MRRYDGNSGRYVHIPEQQPRKDPIPPPPPPPKQALPKKEQPLPNQLGSGIQGLLSNLFSQGFETEDLLLFAVLFLLYQETKDKELLIIMGGMFLL